MDAGRNKQNLQRLYDEVMNEHHVDAADELITPDRPDHDPNLPPEFTEGRDGFKRLFSMFIEAFPDLSFHNGAYGGRGGPGRRAQPDERDPPRSVHGDPTDRQGVQRYMHRTCAGSPMTA